MQLVWFDLTAHCKFPFEHTNPFGSQLFFFFGLETVAPFSSADPPLEVVSGPYYWRTKPAWMDKLALRNEGVYVEKHSSSCLSSCQSYQLFITFLPKKQRLSLAKNFNSTFVLKINHRDGQPSRPRLQWTFPRKTVSIPASEGVRLLPVYWFRLCTHVI